MLEPVQYEFVHDPLNIVEVTNYNAQDISNHLGADEIQYVETDGLIYLRRRYTFYKEGVKIFETHVGDFLIVRDGWLQKIEKSILETQYRILDE